MRGELLTVFTIGTEHLAVPLASVLAVQERDLHFYPLPFPEEGLLGLFEYEDTLGFAMDISPLLNLPAPTTGKLLIVEAAGEIGAFLIDDVLSISGAHYEYKIDLSSTPYLKGEFQSSSDSSPIKLLDLLQFLLAK